VGGRGHCLNRRGLAEIRDFFASRGSDPRPVVLSHEPGSFCTGLDLDEVQGLDRDSMGAFMEQFHHALRAVLTCPVPVVAALSGHALAGGALLALAADARVLATGRARVGVHGVQLGIAYPQVAIELLRYHFARPRLEAILFTGRLCNDRQALRWGWVDELVEVESVEEVARRWALRLASHGPQVFAENKLRSRAVCSERTEVYDREDAERWLDQWFSPSTRDRVRRARTGQIDFAGG